MRIRFALAAVALTATALGGCSTSASDGQLGPFELYQRHCAACHGQNGEGTAVGSELVDLRSGFGPASLQNVIDEGIGTMPGMPSLSDEDVAAIVNYVLEEFSVGGDS